MTSPSMQICMDSTDWLKGIIHDDGSGVESSPTPAELLSCPRPPALAERRPLRPQHDQALKCPRCDSTHTKFCYYNNYSLSQPRYFCKTCRRYWTKGGSLRNVPVGGGCRKNKRSGSKKPAEPHRVRPLSSFPEATNLQLSFPAVQLPQLSLLSTAEDTPSCDFSYTECKYSSMLGGLHLFMDNKNDIGLQLGGVSHGFSAGPSGIFLGGSTLGYSDADGSSEALMEACQSLFPFEANQDEPNAVGMKPGEGVLSLHCHDNCCNADAGLPQSMGYSNRLQSWLE